MEKNLGTADRIVRLIFSVTTIMLVGFRVVGGPLAAALLSLSVVLLITVVISFCPVYRVLGWKSGDEPSTNTDT